MGCEKKPQRYTDWQHYIFVVVHGRACFTLGDKYAVSLTRVSLPKASIIDVPRGNHYSIEKRRRFGACHADVLRGHACATFGGAERRGVKRKESETHTSSKRPAMQFAFPRLLSSSDGLLMEER
jgi:hypothetical protein